MCRIPPNHRSLLYIEFCSSNSSFPELGNIRPSKHSVVVLLPPPPHPLCFPFCRRNTHFHLCRGYVCKPLMASHC